jgi:HK97 family phage portal protein
MDGVSGLSLVQAARNYIAGGLASQQYSNDVFSSGGAERTALKIPGVLKDEEEIKIRKDWNRKYGKDALNKNELAILQAGMEVVKIGLSPEDAQLIDSKKISIEDFSRFTRIPLHMLNHLEKAGYNSLEHMSREFAFYTMKPWITKFEQESNAKLLRETQKEDCFTHYDTSEFVLGDSQAQAELVSKLFPTGAINADEIRELVFNLNPRGDDGGQTYHTAVNVHSDTHAKLKQEKIESDIKKQNNE